MNWANDIDHEYCQYDNASKVAFTRRRQARQSSKKFHKQHIEILYNNGRVNATFLLDFSFLYRIAGKKKRPFEQPI